MKPFDTLAPGAGSSVAIRAPKTLQAFEMLPQGMAPGAGVSSATLGGKSYEVLPNAQLAGQGLMGALKAPRAYEIMPGAGVATRGLKSAGCGCGGKCGPCGGDSAKAHTDRLRIVNRVVGIVDDVGQHGFTPPTKTRFEWPTGYPTTTSGCGAFAAECARWQASYEDMLYWARRMTRAADANIARAERRYRPCSSGQPIENCDSLIRARNALVPSILAASEEYEYALRTNRGVVEAADAVRQLDQLAEQLQNEYQWCSNSAHPRYMEGQTAECRLRLREYEDANWYGNYIDEQVGIRQGNLRRRWMALALRGCQCSTPTIPPDDPSATPDLDFLDDL